MTRFFRWYYHSPDSLIFVRELITFLIGLFALTLILGIMSLVIYTTYYCALYLGAPVNGAVVAAMLSTIAFPLSLFLVWVIGLIIMNLFKPLIDRKVNK